jgi:molybdenum cofactor synthesis domain-containing protein
MAISYAAALTILENTAQEVSTNLEDDPDVVSLEDAVGRVSKNTIFSPVSTPAADASAMDGYAVDSSCTQDASDANPVSLRVVGFLAAGDRTARLPPSTCKACSVATTEFKSCIEIATGARFPAAPYDACIRVEDISPTDPCLRPLHKCPYQYITIVKPAKYNQHRRPAGEDFTKHHVTLHIGETVQPQHVMGLASVGISQIKVTPMLRIGIVSTGSELVPVNNQTNDIEDFQLRNSNGPYLCAAAKHIGAEVDFLGLVEDNVQIFRARLEDALSKQCTRVIVFTGAVSVGKFDFVRQGIEGMGASLEFHKVSGMSFSKESCKVIV